MNDRILKALEQVRESLIKLTMSIQELNEIVKQLDVPVIPKKEQFEQKNKPWPIRYQNKINSR